MQSLLTYREEDLLFFDIETVRAAKDFPTLAISNPLLAGAWLYKTRHQNEIEKKTGGEVTPADYFKAKAALYAPFSEICCIVVGRIKDGKVLRTKAYVGKERQLLQEFATDLGMIVSVRPDTVPAGFNSIGFDGPFMTKRMLVNGITLPPLFDQGDRKPWEVVALDLSKLWQGNAFYPDSLAAVSAALGIASPKTGMDGSEVSDEFYKGHLDKIAEYCTGDVLAVANIYRKFLQKSLVTLQP